MRTTLTQILLFLVAVCSLTTAPAGALLSSEEIDRTFQRINRGEPVETEILLRALISDQTTLRARAAHLLGQTGDLSVVPALINALSDESSHVGANYPDPGMCTTRWWANDSLKRLTQQDFGFRWDASVEARQVVINRWKSWVASSK